MTNKKILVLGTITEGPDQGPSNEPTAQTTSRPNTRYRKPSKKYLDAISALQSKQKKKPNKQQTQEEVADHTAPMSW